MAGTALVTDLKDYRIPNWLVCIGAATGIYVSIMFHGIHDGFRHSLQGMLIPTVLVILYLLKSLGAGDIKLFSAIGTFVGTDIGQIIFISFIAGGVLAIAYVIYYLILILSAAVRGNVSVDASLTGNNRLGKHKLHFSIAIFSAVVFYVTGGMHS